MPPELVVIGLISAGVLVYAASTERIQQTATKEHRRLDDEDVLRAIDFDAFYRNGLPGGTK